MSLKCVSCGRFGCYTGQTDKVPSFCPMKTDKELYKTILNKYLDDDFIKNLALNSARVEAQGYMNWSRIEETVEFALKCGFKKIGVAFCVGLREEAKVLVDILEKNGFKVCSVMCKNGSIPKETLGLKKREKVNPDRYEAMCNPIGQAMLLNRERTELNIIFGLCVGHDTLFIMHSQAPVTCLVVKDRVLAHNPIGAIYTCKHYYKRIYNIKK